MKIKHKLIIGSLLLALVPVLITSISLALGAISNSQQAITAQVENQLIN